MRLSSDCFAMVADASNADFLYATGFKTYDPCIYVVCRDGTELLIVPKMELKRAERESRVKELASFEDLGHKQLIEELGDPRAATAELLVQILKECRARSVSVPHDFPAYIAFRLREHFDVSFENPFRELRVVKSTEEIRKIEDVARAIVRNFAWLVRNFRFERCEEIRAAIESRLFSEGYLAENTIAASGKLSADPHEVGRGRIEEHVVLDVFPRSREHMYYADFTRTIFVSKNEKLEEMYDAVIEAQQKAISMIREGVDAKDVHNTVKDCLRDAGFETRGNEGFIHSTGHGIGLEIHEEPRISERSVELKAGMVVTVEPGLYYRDVGGVRVEDTVVVTKSGCRVLTKFDKWVRIRE